MLNQGKEAGASLEHSHSQIFALPLIPPILQKEIHGTKKYFNQNKRCAVCDLIKFEKKEDKRIVYENKQFYNIAAICFKKPI